jgi:hypothetical protein
VPFPHRARPGRTAALAAAVVLAMLFATHSASAASPSKPFSVSFSASPVPAGVAIPGAMPAGMTISNFTVTLRNDTKTQMLGSANVTPPAAFTVVSAPTVDRGVLLPPDGTTLRLRDLNVSPGGTVTVTMDLRLPCVAGSSYAWTIRPKQSNDYQGTGNDLSQPPAGTLANTVSGACALRFTAGGQPAGAQKNLPIRAEAWQPDSPDLVSVEAVDGRDPGLAQRLTWFSGAIALARGSTTYPGQLVQPGPVAADAGVARFPSLSITAAGFYTVVASTAAPGFATDDRAVSSEFPIVDIVGACGATCTFSLGATTLTGAPGGGTGLVLLSRNIGLDPSCAGYTPPVRDTWYEFTVTAERAKTIVVNYTKAQMKTVQNANALEVCFATPGPLPFPAKNGIQPYDYDGDGTAEGFVGLLPDCTSAPTTACVSNRGPLNGGGAFIEFFVPNTLGDPRYH